MKNWSTIYTPYLILPSQLRLWNRPTTPLQSGKVIPNEWPSYDTKQSDGEVLGILEHWKMRSTPSLPLLPGPLRLGVVAPDRVLSMRQIELNCVLMLNLITLNKAVLIFKLSTYAKYNWLKKNCFWHWNCTYAKLNCLK